MYVYQRSWDILCFWTIFTPLSYFWEGCLLSSGVGTTGDTQWKQLWGQELWTSGHIRPVKGSAFHALIFRSGRMPLPSPVLRAGTAVCTAILSITWCQILSAPVSRIGAVFSGALTLLPAGSALDHMLSEDDTCVFACIYLCLYLYLLRTRRIGSEGSSPKISWKNPCVALHVSLPVTLWEVK